MKTARILVIEDDAGWRELLKDTLEHEGYKVDTAGNADEGMKALATSGLQLVLMDLNLEDKDEVNREGLKLLSLIGLFNPCARAIVFTAHPRHLREAFRASYGVFDYLLKQEFQRATFLGVVRDAIQEAFGSERGQKERPAYPDFV